MKGSLCKVHWIHSMHWSFTNCYKALFRPPYLDLLAGNSQWPQSMSDPYINWFRIYIKFGTDMGLGPISYANRHIKLDILIYNIYQFWQKLDTILYEEVIIWHWKLRKKFSNISFKYHRENWRVKPWEPASTIFFWLKGQLIIAASKHFEGMWSSFKRQTIMHQQCSNKLVSMWVKCNLEAGSNLWIIPSVVNNVS